MHSTTLDAPPRRRNRWLIVGALVALVLAAPFIVYQVLKALDRHDLADAIAELDESDPGWRFQDIVDARPHHPEDANSARQVTKAVKLLGKSGLYLNDKHEQLFEGLPSVNQLNEGQAAVLREAIEKLPQGALAEARKLKDFPEGGRYPVNYSEDMISTNLDALQESRRVMYLLHKDAMLRAHEGDVAGAVQACRAIACAARSLDEPFLISVLIRFAGQAMMVNALERALAQGEAPEAELTALQELVEKEIAEPVLLSGMRGERGASMAMIEAIRSGKLNLPTLFGTGAGPSAWPDELMGTFPGLLLRGEGTHLRLMTRAVESVKLPPEKQAEEIAKIDHILRTDAPRISRLIMPAHQKVAEADRRTQAYLRSAAVALAAERYRLKHGVWPVSGEVLVKEGYLKQMYKDPFDGQGLRLRRGEDGLVVYSVGFDKQDNNGAINRDRPLDPGTDLGFRLWDVSRRAQPALPPRPPVD